MQFLLSEDFSDEAYVNNLSEDISVLQDMANGKLDEADSARAWNILNRNVQRKDLGLLQQREENSKANNENYATYNDFITDFKNETEELPDDYKIKNIDDTLKDLGITKKNPKVIKTPVENIEVRVSSIKHIIDGGGNTHLPDKNRYKCINKMFATLKRPNIVLQMPNGNNEYIKIFNSKNKAKNQVVVVYKDKSGNYVHTAFPVNRDKRYLLNELNKGTVIYKKGQTRVLKDSAAISSITNFQTDFKGDVKQHEVKNRLYQSVYFQEIEPEQQNIFPGNRVAKKIHKVKGGYLPAEKFIEMIISDITKKAIWVFQLNNFLRASFFGALFCIVLYTLV